MNRIHSVIVVAVGAACILQALVPAPARAQAGIVQCVGIAADRAYAEKKGLKWLGSFKTPIPSEGGAFVFYSKDGRMYFSPVLNGCVSQSVFYIGRMPAATPAAVPKGTPT